MLLISLIITIIFIILNMDFWYATHILNYSHWKKEQISKNMSFEYERYVKNWETIIELLSCIVPIVNIFWYIATIIVSYKEEFKYSSKAILEDVKSRGKGIHGFLLKHLWKKKPLIKEKNGLKKSAY